MGLHGDKNNQWWGFDLPVKRDWLFWTSCGVCVVLVVAGPFVHHTFIAWTGLPLAALFLGCIAGAARNFWRGLREPDPGRAPKAS